VAESYADGSRWNPTPCSARCTRLSEAAPPYVPQDHRPGLFFREDFKGPPAGVHIAPLTQEFIANPQLELKLYGAGKQLQIDNSPLPKDDPNFVWTGLTESN
jgi:hypothetical protein